MKIRRPLSAAILGVALAGCGAPEAASQGPTSARRSTTTTTTVVRTTTTRRPTTTTTSTTTTTAAPITTSTTAAPPATARPTTTTTTTAPRSVNFVGQWQAHCCGLSIDGSGGFRFAGRTYVWCTDGPPPCDTIVGNEIHDGTLASGVITARSGNTAVARAASTTDTALIPWGSVSFVINPANDTLTIQPTGVVLCGSAAPPFTCGA